AVCKKGLEKAQVTNRVLFHVELARAHAALDDLKAALASAEDAVRDAGKPERLFARLVRVDVLVQMKKYDQAVAACQELLKEYNHGGELREVRTALSNVYAAAGDHDKSEAQLKLILEADPNDALACNNLGYHWADRSKNLAQAEALIRKALQLD